MKRRRGGGAGRGERTRRRGRERRETIPVPTPTAGVFVSSVKNRVRPSVNRASASRGSVLYDACISEEIRVASIGGARSIAEEFPFNNRLAWFHPVGKEGMKNLADSASRGGGTRYPCTETVLTTRAEWGARAGIGDARTRAGTVAFSPIKNGMAPPVLNPGPGRSGPGRRQHVATAGGSSAPAMPRGSVASPVRGERCGDGGESPVASAPPDERLSRGAPPA